MRKLTPVEIFILFVVILCLGLYIVPKITLSVEQKQYGRLQTNAAMMTSKILAEFSDNKNTKKPSETAQELADEMNKLVKNPINKKNKAYCINEDNEGCILIAPNDKMKNIVLSAKDKNGEFVVRTIIQPPSYVTYNKDLKNAKQHN